MFEKCFGGKTTLYNADKDQSILLIEIVECKKNINRKVLKKKQQERDTLKNVNALYEVREMAFNFFKNGIFSLPLTEGTGFEN